MRIVAVIFVALSMTMLSGCAGNSSVIRTIKEIKRSDYRAEYASNKVPAFVNDWMMLTLYRHTRLKEERPYGEVTTETYGTTRAIMLRTPKNLGNQMDGGGDELLFLIENSIRDGGSKSTVWVNQRFLSAKSYLDDLTSVIGVCL